MKIEEFVKLVKECKKIQKETAFVGEKVIKYSDTKYKFQKEEKCKRCGTQLNKRVIVEFHKPQQLTIFEAGMLYLVLAEKKLPHDYARYHKCQAGQEFIENIKEVIR